MYQFEYVWQNLTSSHKSEIKNFWARENAIPKNEIETRVDEVIFILKDENGNILGLTTGIERHIELLRHKMLLLRQYIKPAYRSGLIPYQLAKRSILKVEEYYDSSDKSPLGVLTIIENQKMLDKNYAVWPRINLVYIGNTNRSQHMRVRFFKNAEVK